MLDIKNLNHYFEDKPVLTNINFSVKKGETLAIIGESGAGKSTLLQLISGLVDIQKGEILLNGRPVEGPSKKLIAGHPEIKLVAQDFRLNPNFSVEENIKYPLRQYTKVYQQERTFSLMAQLGISEIAQNLPKNTSGGEKQRTAIAKALAEPPNLLLLDEPFSNLDNLNKNKLKSMLSALIKLEKMACIFVTHDLLDAIQMATNVAILHHSMLLEILPIHQLKDYKGHQYIEQFISASLAPLSFLK